MPVREKRCLGIALHMRQPLLEALRRGLPERHGPFLATLAVQMDAGTLIEGDVPNAHVDDLRDARSGVVHRGEQHVITPAVPGGGIGRSQYCFHLLAREKAHQWAIKAFGGDSERALDYRERGGIMECSVMQEGADSRETGISSTGLVLPLAFEMIEEAENQGRIQFSQRQR